MTSVNAERINQNKTGESSIPLTKRHATQKHSEPKILSHNIGHQYVNTLSKNQATNHHNHPGQQKKAPSNCSLPLPKNKHTLTATTTTTANMLVFLKAGQHQPLHKSSNKHYLSYVSINNRTHNTQATHLNNIQTPRLPT